MKRSAEDLRIKCAKDGCNTYFHRTKQGKNSMVSGELICNFCARREKQAATVPTMPDPLTLNPFQRRKYSRWG